LLAVAQSLDLGIVARAFRAAVPGAVEVLSVAVVVAIGLVVLLVVGDQVLQREAIVAGDEVDARVRPPAVVLIEVGGPREAKSEVGQGRGLAPPEVTDGVAVPGIPLGPEHGEVTDLVTPFAHVPRLGAPRYLDTHTG